MAAFDWATCSPGVGVPYCGLQGKVQLISEPTKIPGDDSYVGKCYTPQEMVFREHNGEIDEFAWSTGGRNRDRDYNDFYRGTDACDSICGVKCACGSANWMLEECYDLHRNGNTRYRYSSVQDIYYHRCLDKCIDKPGAWPWYLGYCSQ